MEIIQPYLGHYEKCSIFLNHGKYGPYLNYNDKLLTDCPTCVFLTALFFVCPSMIYIILEINLDFYIY